MSGQMMCGPRSAAANLIAVNFLFYGVYSLSTGPTKNTLRRIYGMQPETLDRSWVISAPFMNTSIVPVVANSALIWHVANKYQSLRMNQHNWARVTWFLLVGISASCYYDCYTTTDREKLYAGSTGLTMGLVTYMGLKSPHVLSAFRMGPYGFAAGALTYSLLTDDRSVMAGVGFGWIAAMLM